MCVCVCVCVRALARIRVSVAGPRLVLGFALLNPSHRKYKSPRKFKDDKLQRSSAFCSYGGKQYNHCIQQSIDPRSDMDS